MADKLGENATHAVYARNANGTVGFIVGGLTRAEAVVVVDNITYFLCEDVWTESET